MKGRISQTTFKTNHPNFEVLDKNDYENEENGYPLRRGTFSCYVYFM